MKNKGFIKILLIFLLLIAGGFYWYINKDIDNKDDYVMGDGPIKTYVSEQLGIKFDFLSNSRMGIDENQIKRLGNKIFFLSDYDVDNITEQTKYIEVWQKDPNLDLIDIVENITLKNYDKNKCKVVIGEFDNFYTAKIEINLSNEDFWKNPEICSIYGNISGNNGFRSPKNNPELYFYYFAGQDSWPSGNDKTHPDNKTVFDTIRGL